MSLVLYAFISNRCIKKPQQAIDITFFHDTEWRIQNPVKHLRWGVLRK